MKKRLRPGQIVCSSQGRDKGQYYLVFSADENFAYLCDGEAKKLDNPKKKNIKHIKPTKLGSTIIARKLKENKKINDQMIYHSLHEYKKRYKGS